MQCVWQKSPRRLMVFVVCLEHTRGLETVQSTSFQLRVPAPSPLSKGRSGLLTRREVGNGVQKHVGRPTFRSRGFSFKCCGAKSNDRTSSPQRDLRIRPHLAVSVQYLLRFRTWK
ncbi:hypothetical protein B0T10DRAFT_497462 [Thelonectria olida]|uniref:Uncharacterized protein n=1 Tax=Thelonectria olida TaxID=1576542 RepID=A0A9P9AK73_9HYPO|nr:hypothetical protein B0T10DRAFT_497462 [Thelonectria olida]